MSSTWFLMRHWVDEYFNVIFHHHRRPILSDNFSFLGNYDDENGSYLAVQHDHIAYRKLKFDSEKKEKYSFDELIVFFSGYEVLKILGKGSFGLVVKCYDHKSGQQVALKIIRNEKRFHRQAQEEIRILEHLRKQDRDNTFNIIHMSESFQFRNHICITFELLAMNLYEYARKIINKSFVWFDFSLTRLIKKNRFQGFSLQLVRKFAHSILQCLDALHRNKIIHCGNIRRCSNCFFFIILFFRSQARKYSSQTAGKKWN